MSRTAIVGACVLGAAAGLLHARSAPATRARFLMGARLVITADGAGAGPAIEAAFGEVERLDAVLSNWRGDSELSDLNRNAVTGPARCSPDLYGVVEAAVRWAAETGGAFDPTVEPLVREFGLRGRDGRLPGTPETGGGDASAAPISGEPWSDADAPWGWRHVRLDTARSTVAFDAPGVGLDLGGIGKGYALDAALRVLVARGVRSALLDFSGQILVHGRGPDAGGWVVGVSGPGDRDRPLETIRIETGSLSSSGNGERSILGDRAAIGHILDPGSGLPATYPGTVTVMARDGTSADALSTALFVMGPERGVTWARTHQVDALFLWPGSGGEIHRAAAGRFGAAVSGSAGAEQLVRP